MQRWRALEGQGREQRDTFQAPGDIDVSAVKHIVTTGLHLGIAKGVTLRLSAEKVLRKYGRVDVSIAKVAKINCAFQKLSFAISATLSELVGTGVSMICP